MTRRGLARGWTGSDASGATFGASVSRSSYFSLRWIVLILQGMILRAAVVRGDGAHGGKQEGPYALLGATLLDVRADPVTVVPTTNTFPAAHTLAADCLLYLGQASGTMVVYDPGNHQSIRVPGDSVVLTHHDNPSCHKASDRSSSGNGGSTPVTQTTTTTETAIERIPTPPTTTVTTTAPPINATATTTTTLTVPHTATHTVTDTVTPPTTTVTTPGPLTTTTVTTTQTTTVTHKVTTTHTVTATTKPFTG